jgi:hypothetical protein
VDAEPADQATYRNHQPIREGGSQTKWSNRFNLVLCIVWLVVLIAAGMKLFDGKARRRGVDEVGLCRR